MTVAKKQWRFWVDRGGTFTDVVALSPEGKLHTHKLLSERYAADDQSTIQGIRDVLSLSNEDSLPVSQIAEVRLGSTVTTNALLERKGAATALLVTKGYHDALRIAYQNRPDIFALDVKLPQMLYQDVVEVDERISAKGEVLKALNEVEAEEKLTAIYAQGIRSLAIVLLHSYAYPQHEQCIEVIAKKIGFNYVEVSHKVTSLIKYMFRNFKNIKPVILLIFCAGYAR